MNRYATTARNYFRDFLPTRYSQIENPEEFFQDLGQQIQDQVVDLTPELAGPDPAGETYLDKVSRLNAARRQAEELVMADLVYSQKPEIDPEPEPEIQDYYQQVQETMLELHHITSTVLDDEDPPPTSSQNQPQ